MANPIAASAAATVKMNKVKIWPVISFKKIEKEQGLDECFLIREVHDDVSALRFYLDIEDYRELNFFSYGKDKNNDYVINDISDEEGFKQLRIDISKNIGINSIPLIYVNDMKDNELILQHDHDGRDIDLTHATRVVDNIKSIWPTNVKLFTIIEDELWEMWYT